MQDQPTGTLPWRIKALYERVNVDRARALEDLEILYSADVQFRNPVAQDHGIAEFRKAWAKAFRLYKRFEFVDIAVVGTDELFSAHYSMNIQFAIGPVFRIDMVTVCRGREGKVVYVRDYFDPLGSLVGPIAPLRWLYNIVFRALVA